MSDPRLDAPGTLRPPQAGVPVIPGSPIPAAAVALEGRLSVVAVEDEPGGAVPLDPYAGVRPSAGSTRTPAGGRSGAVHRPGTIPVLVVAGLVAGLLVIIGVFLTVENWTRGVPWQPRLIILVGARWVGILLALGIGLWWWRRAPANPTGRLLFLAGICDCVFLIGADWPYAAWAYELTWAWYLVQPLLALIVLGWPTGRPRRRIRRAVIVITAAVVLITLVGGVFRRSPEATAEWPNWPHALFSVPVVWELLDPIQAMVFAGIPAIAVIVLLIRRRRAVPPAVRPLITPITVAGVLVAGSVVVLHFGYQIFGALIPDVDGDISTVRLLVLMGLYLELAFVAVGVLVGATRRRRAVAVGTRQVVIDLRSAAPVVSPSTAAGALVADPSAVVRYRRADGRWIGHGGEELGELGGDRRMLPVLDESGDLVAGLEIDASTPVPPLLADLAVSTIAARAANERAAAVAAARRLEVTARSTDLVAAADAGRVALERALHDGAQQYLVGLALTAGLRARDEASGGVPDRAAAGELISQIDQVHRDILELVDSSAPAALSAGLAGALRSIAVVCPVTASFAADGDLPPDDPMSLGLYLAAGEALTNAVKHSGGTGITMLLTVDPVIVRILVQDDGIGGVRDVPPGLAGRARDLQGSVEVESRPGRGTTVRITVPRTTGGTR